VRAILDGRQIDVSEFLAEFDARDDAGQVDPVLATGAALLAGFIGLSIFGLGVAAVFAAMLRGMFGF